MIDKIIKSREAAQKKNTEIFNNSIDDAIQSAEAILVKMRKLKEDVNKDNDSYPGVLAAEAVHYEELLADASEFILQ